ncbi:TetR/AcrR family transcriptional regulator [Nocardia amamiensis]|uniref:TetR/AcrR family transcriptional regulator n=1 Tax=Nocardia amamiensis TaxID=404578 RepID=UPI0033DB8C34
MVVTGNGQTRRRRRPEEVRREILDATAAELAEVGVDQASLRSIARRAGLSHQLVAHHFGDRRAVLTAAAVDGFDDLIARTADAVTQVPADVPLGEHAIAVGTTYVQFARERPALFALMLGSTQVDDLDPDLIDRRLRIWNLLLNTVTKESNNGWGGPVEPEYMALLAWTVVHGLATLGRANPHDTGVEDLLRTLNRAIIHPGNEPASGAD